MKQKTSSKEQNSILYSLLFLRQELLNSYDYKPNEVTIALDSAICNVVFD